MYGRPSITGYGPMKHLTTRTLYQHCRSLPNWLFDKRCPIAIKKCGWPLRDLSNGRSVSEYLPIWYWQKSYNVRCIMDIFNCNCKLFSGEHRKWARGPFSDTGTIGYDGQNFAIIIIIIIFIHIQWMVMIYPVNTGCGRGVTEIMEVNQFAFPLKPSI